MRALALTVVSTAFVVLVACDPSSPTPDPGPDSDAVDAECEEIPDGRTICFPYGHVCYDPHGIGDGEPIEIDCWTEGSRGCNYTMPGWPGCNGGWEQD